MKLDELDGSFVRVGTRMVDDGPDRSRHRQRLKARTVTMRGRKVEARDLLRMSPQLR